MSVREFYLNGEYLQRNPDWHIAASAWKASAILKMMRRNNLAPHSVCDIGCGAGEILRLLQQQMDSHCTFRGYDIAPQAIEMARERQNELLQFTLGDFRTLDQQEYDLILLIDVIQHFENFMEYLRALKSKSQYKILQIPLDLFVFSALSNELIEYFHAAGHIHFFTKDIALEMLRLCDYEVVDYFYTLPPIDTNSWRSALLHPFTLPRKVIRVTKRGLQRLPGSLLYPMSPDLAVRIFGGWRLMVLVR
jgi:SAM-dependent methyltransferase